MANGRETDLVRNAQRAGGKRFDNATGGGRLSGGRADHRCRCPRAHHRKLNAGQNAFVHSVFFA